MIVWNFRENIKVFVILMKISNSFGSNNKQQEFMESFVALLNDDILLIGLLFLSTIQLDGE